MSRLITLATSPSETGRPAAAATLTERLARLFAQEPDLGLLVELALGEPDPCLPTAIADKESTLRTIASIADVDECREEFERLFEVRPWPLVAPCESAWTDPARLMGRSHLDTLGDYRKAGLFVPRRPADHISVELAFIALLIRQREIEILRSFWVAHAVNWMPQFAAALARETRVPFYAAAARLLEVALRPIRRTTDERETAKATAGV